MVKVVDNEIVETFYTLVNPHDYFSETNIHVHGIHPEDVKGAPDFKVAVIEIDEGSIPKVLKEVTPSMMVFTNFFRDQSNWKLLFYHLFH